MSRFKLASAPTLTVISWRKFQIWRIFLVPSAGHWKRCGRPHAAREPLTAHDRAKRDKKVLPTKTINWWTSC